MLYLDIETKADLSLKEIYTANIRPPANYKDQTKIAEWLLAKAAEAEVDMALDQDFCTISVVAVAEDDQEPKLVTLQELMDLFGEHYNIITFNGKSFDFPILIKQCIKQGIPPNAKLLNGLQKYKTYPHKDLLEVLAMNGQYKSLDKYIQIYLGIAKTPIDFATCTAQELENHCLEDVQNLRRLYKKFEYVFV